MYFIIPKTTDSNILMVVAVVILKPVVSAVERSRLITSAMHVVENNWATSLTKNTSFIDPACSCESQIAAEHVSISYVKVIITDSTPILDFQPSP